MSSEDVLPEDLQAQASESPSGNASNEPATLESLSQELVKAQQTAQENWDRFIRTQAEFENLKRRSEKDIQNAHKFAIEKFARELLSVADSLELGLEVEASDNPEVAKLREGMELTLKQLLASLEKFQLVQINPEGERFNPELHQAMAMQPAPNIEPNTVLKVYQKGYLLSERLLRPAMVVVAQAPQ